MNSDETEGYMAEFKEVMVVVWMSIMRCSFMFWHYIDDVFHIIRERKRWVE